MMLNSNAEIFDEHCYFYVFLWHSIGNADPPAPHLGVAFKGGAKNRIA